MVSKTWNILNTYKPGCDVIDIILENRGIVEKKDVKTFLNPPSINLFLKDLPFEFKASLKQARNLIFEAMKNKSPIIIHGDYDADGICASAILFNTLKYELGYKDTFVFIPNRFKHGYGLSKSSIDAVIKIVAKSLASSENKKSLFITVDSGITSVAEVSYIKKLGHDVIITDHHQKPSKLPKADYILWNDTIVGATISWLLSKSLGSKNSNSIALAGLATVTDVQPLIGFNRTIVKNALSVLNENPPLGIKALLDVAKKSRGEITTYDLGWILGPRLNASGRLQDASNALDLLTSKDKKEVLSFAQKLNDINSDRQDKTLKMYELATTFDEKKIPKIIISRDENYHEGIIGLVAARLSQKYYRPAIVISEKGGVGKGSVRSVSGIDIISLLRKAEELFENVGGHPMAAGFTINLKNISKLEKKLETLAKKHIKKEQLIQKLTIDLEIPFSIIDLEFVKSLNVLKPFGIKNQEPKFVTNSLTIADITFVGREKKHLTMRVTDGSNTKKAIYFNALENDLVKNLRISDTIDIVYKLKENMFNGKTYIDLHLIDLKQSKPL